MRAVIACGGTGGHLFPGLAVGEELRARGHEVLLVVSEKEIDRIALREHPGFRSEQLASRGMPSIFSPAILSFAGSFFRGASQCRRWYRDFGPDVVLGMGGFTSTAPLLAGWRRGLPCFVHESNAIPGKANRLNAKFCRTVLVGFEACAAQFASRSVEVTGTPVRESLRHPPDRAAARDRFGLSTDAPVLLVMGGSQGAHGINTSLATAAPLLAPLGLEVLHFTGGGDERMMAECYRIAGIKAYVADFHHRMDEAYAAADVVVARAGASSLSELAWFGLPSILIPYPHAAEDHQTQNARIFSGAGAAELLPESEAKHDVLAGRIRGLFTDRVEREKMAAAARSLSPAGAEARIAELLERSCTQ